MNLPVNQQLAEEHDKAKIGQVFEHEAKLQSLRQRQKELENALDITKNQASNALAAEETELQVEKEAEAESVRNKVGQLPDKVSIVKSISKMRVAMAH